MTNAEFLKLLVDRKVADSYQFYDSCQYKLDMAELSYKALQNLIAKYQKEEADLINSVFAEARQKGKAVYKSHKNVVDFFGVEIDTTVAIEKLFAEITGILHNFFDTFAQWINTSLFGEKALPIRRVSLNSVIAKMPDFPEYSGTFITDFLGIIADPRFIYISDLNNTQKHRYQLYVENRFDLLAAQGEVNVPNFEKDGRIHVKADILGVVADVLNYCRKLLTDSRSFVESYYTVNACGYVDHRIYNPHTYLFFASKEDCEHLKSPKNHYHYIEIDEANILQEYQIMLVHDSLGQEDGSIEMFNSVYPIIMLRNQSDERIVGILTPEDGESFHFHDAHNLLYRKYKAITTNYQVAMHQAICEGEFKYYPLLSDATLIYDLSNSDSSEQHTN